MEDNEYIECIRGYNKTLPMLKGSRLEREIVKSANKNSFLGYHFNLEKTYDDVEDFIEAYQEFSYLMKENKESLCFYLRHLTLYTCNKDVIRMDVRSQNFSLYHAIAIKSIWAFYIFYASGMKIKDLVYGRYRQNFKHIDFSSVIASELLQNNQEVIDYCIEVLESENNTAVLTRDVIVAIEKSENSKLQDLLTQVFLAAQLQEGLRQSVIETVDEYQFSYFMKILDVIKENNLLRFSSVKRGIMTWIGIGYAMVKEKEIAFIFDHMYTYFKEENQRVLALSSENPLLVYLALYVQGAKSLEIALQEAKDLLESKQRHIVACAIIYLKQTHQFSVDMFIDDIEKYKEDEWIQALYLLECTRQDFNRLQLTETQCLKLFDWIESDVSQMKSKQVYSSKGFEWFEVTIHKLYLSKVLFEIIKKYPKVSLIDRVIPYMSQTLYYDSLNEFMEKYFDTASLEVRKAFLIKEIISNDVNISKWVMKKYQTMTLLEKDIELLEQRLKTKKSLARGNIISVLACQKKESVLLSYQRLLLNTDKLFQEAAMEVKLKASQYFEEENQEIEILNKEEGFGLYRPLQFKGLGQPQFLQIKEKGFFKKTLKVDLSSIFPMSKSEILAYIKKWNDRVTLHENEEYYMHNHYHLIKGSPYLVVDYSKKDMSALPFESIWRDYFKEDYLNEHQLFQIMFCLQRVEEDLDYLSWVDIDTPLFSLDKKDIKDFSYFNVISKIFYYYFIEESQHNNFSSKAIQLLELIHYYSKKTYMKAYDYNSKRYKQSIGGMMSYKWLLSCVDLLKQSDELFIQYFPVIYAGYMRFTIGEDLEVRGKPLMDPLILTRAYMLDMISKEVVIEGILDTHNKVDNSVYFYNSSNKDQLFECFRDVYYEGKGVHVKPHLSLEDYQHGYKHISLPVVEMLRTILDEISYQLITMESKRLNDETEVTDYVHQLYINRGIYFLVLALKVLEGEDLKRQTMGKDRASIFTNVIRHSYPLVNESIQPLIDLGLKEERLVEVAMLAPQWMDTMNQVLNWEGFKEACYYFIAHMKQYDFAQKKAEIVNYTDIDPEDLNEGAFDIQWCKDVYQTLGSKRFKMVYKAAKFLCENSFHTRARKYADACLGLIDKEVLYQQIVEKRNKDSLNAYCIYPIKDEKEILERYLLIQQFLKESKQFGSQRQISEKKACEMALYNLARNTKYKTITRLSWIMESESILQYQHYLVPQEIGDISIWIEIDAFGHNDIVLSKNGKKQKSIPASLKKNETILEMKKIHNQWNEQYRRSRQMLQTAMEEQTIFSKEEIEVILKNPIVSPMLKKLVFINEDTIGFLQEGNIIGKETYPFPQTMRIAHPYDLYEKGCWSFFQSYLFEHKIIQPFKQIFRELYTKLEDELEETISKRYTGYQIQPKKVAATLKTRQWNISYENGIERVYHKDNLVVQLYAQADWFSPSDIEAPSIDYVMFNKRKTYEPYYIKDVSPILFSETMRDLDLAVSVSYVGGVDPKTSFSTMELRKTIIEYTCQLLKLTQVTLSDHFVNIKGALNDYTIHLGSGVIHQTNGGSIHLVNVISGHRGKVFLPFLDEDPKTVELVTKVIMFAEDNKIKDPSILNQIISRDSL